MASTSTWRTIASMSTWRTMASMSTWRTIASMSTLLTIASMSTCARSHRCPPAHDRGDVHAVDDCLDVDGRDQRVDIDALQHKRCEVQAVEHLVHHGRDDSRDDPVEVGTRGCPRYVAPVGEGLDDASRMQAFIQDGRVHDNPSDRRGRPSEATHHRHGRTRRHAAAPSAASTATGTVRFDEVSRAGSSMRP